MNETYEVSAYEQWRKQARDCLQRNLSPSDVHFVDAREAQAALGIGSPSGESMPPKGVRVPADFLSLGKVVSQHRAAGKWDLLYQVLWRLTHGEPNLLSDQADECTLALFDMEKAVRRDIHKMHAFVRFRRTADEVYVAWHRPDHWIVRSATPFFVRRFGSMRWSILTPDECAYYDGERLTFGAGFPSAMAPSEDGVEDLWLTYYASIFNPARLKISAMKAEMPVRHWPTLPETKLIPQLIQNAEARVGNMVSAQPPSATPYLPDDRALPSLQEQAKQCRGCELFQAATQVVFGRGKKGAKIMLVGEQPGDQEDLQGEPFVGPAGKLLDRALLAAGIARDQVYVTNAVKHFHFEERGKRRIHKKPKGIHISACRPWLEAEIAAVEPETIVCLGATAARSLLGREVGIEKERGIWQPNRFNKRVLVTIHPSFLLRTQSFGSPEEEFERFVEDLKKAKP